MTRWDIEPGDIIEIGVASLRVTAIEDLTAHPDLTIPTAWPPAIRNRCAVILGVCLDGPNHGATARTVVPTLRPYDQEHAGLRIVAKSHDEGHYPRCDRCDEAWPCTEMIQMRSGRELAAQTERHLANAATYPVLCPRDCGRRFRTQRGANQHARRHKLTR